jgi:hypothetical protein
LKLEDLQPDAAVRGILPDALVTVVSVEWHGSDALTLVCPPGLAWKRPGLPNDWVRVLERHPDGVAAQPGYVWLEMPGKVRHASEHELEFR